MVYMDKALMARLVVVAVLLAVEVAVVAVVLRAVLHLVSFLHQLVVRMVAVAVLLFFKVAHLFAVVRQLPHTDLALARLGQSVLSGPETPEHSHQLAWGRHEPLH